jgi:uncharacterized phiE125 gp8 family phage protein
MNTRHETEVSRPTVLTGPTAEPITLAEVKRQLFLAESDTSQDAELLSRIQAAREKWESDTDTYLLTQTLSVTAEAFAGREIELSGRPIQSITSIQYYDENNTLQTFSSSLYSFNATEREIELKWNETWPVTAIRWDAVKITYVAGYTSIAAVPAIYKQSMLHFVTYLQYGNRGDNDRPNDLRAYENLVRNNMRSSYP